MVEKRKFLLPILVVLLGSFATILIVHARPKVERVERPAVPPLVRVVRVEPEDVTLRVSSQGTVLPRTETELMAEVAGRIVEVAPGFVNGGFFDPGEVLVRLDARDYELARTRATAQVEQARVRLLREEAEASLALEEWKKLGQGEADPLVLRQPQVAEAKAQLAAARAELQKARLDLDRTRIRAPFAGRVRHKSADVGRFVNRGTPLATVYAVDYAEVRLPVPDRELAYLDLDLGYRGEDREVPGPLVELGAQFAGQSHTWQGRIVRTEGEIDPRSRMIHLVARVKNPYGRGKEPTRPPLAVGLFVEAEIVGRTVTGVFDLPRAALRGEDQVLVVDSEKRLRLRRVDVLRLESRRVVVQGGLAAGERVCVSTLDTVVPGMEVRTDDPS